MGLACNDARSVALPNEENDAFNGQVDVKAPHFSDKRILATLDDTLHRDLVL